MLEILEEDDDEDNETVSALNGFEFSSMNAEAIASRLEYFKK